MALLPEKHSERIAFFSSRLALWTTNATAIGTTSAAVTALDALVTSATDALAAQTAAHNAAKASTQTLLNAMEAMTNSGMAIVEQVRTKARSAGNSVYPLANIPEPATPAPKPAPGKPSNLVVTLSETGVLELKWKCENPAGTSGTLYQIWRKIGEAGTLEYLGGSGEKEFTDDTLPAGSINVEYQIQAVRSTAVGAYATFNVRFGVSPSGAVTATVTETTAAKLAA